MEERKAKKEEGTEASGEVLAPSFPSFSLQAAMGLLLPLSVPGQTWDILKLFTLKFLLKDEKYSLTHAHIHTEGKEFYLSEGIMRSK